MKNTKFKLVIIISAILVLLTGCGNEEEIRNLIERKNWQLIFLGDDPALKQNIPTIYFDGSMMSGVSCNKYSSTYDLNGDRFSSEIAMATRTLLGCGKEVNDQETLFLNFLANVKKISVIDGLLYMTRWDGLSLIFEEVDDFK